MSLCQRRISLRYPLFEILSGLLLVSWYIISRQWGKLFFFIYNNGFYYITVIDKKWQIIPDFTLLLKLFLPLV